MYDVTIIGAGVVGAMIARKLSAYNLKICILERENDVAMGATRANSAIVHAGFDAKPGSNKAKLNVRGAELMEKVTAELGVKYKRNGSLVIGFNDEDRKAIKDLYERGAQNGVESLRIIERDELKKIEANISDDAVCALLAPTGAIVCPYELTIAAVGNAMDNGAELKLNFEVKNIEIIDGGYKISSDNERVTTRVVINAAGLYADEIAKMIGDNSFGIHPRRGEYLLFDKGCGEMVSHTIFRTPTKMGKGILISPTVDRNLLAGPTSVDMEDKENKDTTADGLASIIKEANENIKGIPFGKTITSFCGLRAAGDTGDFIITSPLRGFLNFAGIESPGLSASPAIAELAEKMVAEHGIKLVKKENYCPTRKPMHYFREASVAEKNEIIKKDKSFGKVICRCETVTEGEILEAIRTNPKPRDLDGIKRRTRAQMGRCQGGFCGPYIVELLSREQGIDYDKVTKFGKGSYVNIGKTKEDR